jgi:hypothetical protein
MKNPVGKHLPSTLLGVMNPCHLYDERRMMRPYNTTDTLSTFGGSLCHIPLLMCRRPRRPLKVGGKRAIPEQVGPRMSNTVQARHVLLHRISSRHQRWPTIAIYIVGGHLAFVNRASGSPQVPVAAPVEAAVNLKGVAQTCDFCRSCPFDLGLGCALSPSSR